MEMVLNNTQKNRVEIKNAIKQILKVAAQCVPNGVLVFFPSYIYMNQIFNFIKNEKLSKKIFIEK